MHFLQKVDSRLGGHVMDTMTVRNKLYCAHACMRDIECG